MKLNFNEIERPTLDIVLNDKAQTELTLVCPDKTTVDSFRNIFENIMNKSEASLDDLYDCCAKLLSFNKEGIVIDKEMIENLFDLNAIIILFKTYKDFIYNIQSQKN